MRRSTPVAQIDVFTTMPYSGNPAGVCLLAETRDVGWMSSVAKELACANTAFAQRRGSGDGYDLRWFTSGGVEVALCGHATLATAHMLFEDQLLSLGEAARFHTKSGVLTATRRPDGAVEMNFPVELATAVPQPPGELARALGQTPVWIGRNRLDYLVELPREIDVRTLAPDLGLLATIETRGFIVTAKADDPSASEYDYVLRFFAPRVGVSEDMVTGTAQCALASYWLERLGSDPRRELVAYQASARGGIVRVRLVDDRVLISGHAVTVVKGEMLA